MCVYFSVCVQVIQNLLDNAVKFTRSGIVSLCVSLRFSLLLFSYSISLILPQQNNCFNLSHFSIWDIYPSLSYLGSITMQRNPPPTHTYTHSLCLSLFRFHHIPYQRHATQSATHSTHTLSLFSLSSQRANLYTCVCVCVCLGSITFRINATQYPTCTHSLSLFLSLYFILSHSRVSRLHHIPY